MATDFAKEFIEITREDQLWREDWVLQDTCTVRSERRIVKLACKNCRDRGEGKG